MNVALILLAHLAAGDALVLREQASVDGRWVRLSDLLDADKSGSAGLASAREIWMGRAPESGETRIVTAVEVRRELERRGIDPSAFELVGERTLLRRGADLGTDPARMALAFEIKRHLLESDPALSPDGLVSVHPDSLPAGLEFSGVRARAGGFQVGAVDPSGKPVDLLVEAQVLRRREVAFARREISAGRKIGREDLEFRRLDVSGEEGYGVDAEALIGAASAVRIPAGSPLRAADLKLKMAVRKGDVVRAVSPGYEVDVRVLEDGAPGQEIDAEFLSSRRRLRARVIDGTRLDVAGEGR
jgi:flagella basal body P-ring formation protein FlgA